MPALYAVVFCDMLGFSMLIPDVQLRAEAMGLRGWEIGGILASMFIVQSVASPFWGRISDGRGRKTVIVACTGISSSSMLLYAFARFPLLVLASRMLAGLGAANIAAAFALTSVAIPETDRPAALARLNAVSVLGLSFGPVLGGLVEHSRGQLWLGLVAAMSSALGALFAAALIRDDRPDSAVSAAGSRSLSLLRIEPAFRALFLLAGVAWLSLASLEGTFGRLIERLFGYGQREFGFIFGYESLVMFVAQIALVGIALKRLPLKPALALSFVLMGVGLCATPFSPTVWVLVGVTTLYALGSALASPAINEFASQTTTEGHRGEAFGLMQSARSIGFFVGPAIGGALFDARIWLPYAFAGGVCVLASLGSGFLPLPCAKAAA